MTRSTALNPKVILLIAEMEMTNILCKRANENPDIQKKKTNRQTKKQLCSRLDAGLKRWPWPLGRAEQELGVISTEDLEEQNPV